MSTAFAIAVLLLVSAATVISVVSTVTSSGPSRPNRTGREADYDWHLVLRCHNTAETIGETLDHLATAFPGAHVWVADECSTDGTAEIVSRRAAENPHIRLLRISESQLARGTGYVLHTVYWSISRAIGADADRQQTIIGLLDPVSRLSPEALDVLAERHNFGYADLGAVQLGQHRGGRRVRAPYPDRGAWQNMLARAVFRVQDITLRGPIPAGQLRRHRHGAAELAGTGQFIRLTALDDLAAGHGTAWPTDADDGAEQATRCALAGWRTGYTDQAWVTEVGRWSLTAYVRGVATDTARTLRATRHLRELARTRALPARTRLAIAGGLLRPWGGLLATVAFLVPPVLLVGAVLAEPAGVVGFLLAGGWAAVVTYAVVAFSEFAAWGLVYGRRVDPRSGMLRGLGWGLCQAVLLPAVYAGMWRGLVAAVSGRTTVGDDAAPRVEPAPAPVTSPVTNAAPSTTPASTTPAAPEVTTTPGVPGTPAATGARAATSTGQHLVRARTIEPAGPDWSTGAQPAATAYAASSNGSMYSNSATYSNGAMYPNSGMYANGSRGGPRTELIHTDGMTYADAPTREPAETVAPRRSGGGRRALRR